MPVVRYLSANYLSLWSILDHVWDMRIIVVIFKMGNLVSTCAALARKRISASTVMPMCMHALGNGEGR